MTEEANTPESASIKRHYSRRLQVDMVGEGAIVGLAVGVIITLYRISLSYAETFLRSALPTFEGSMPLKLGWMAALLALSFLVAFLMHLEPNTRGSGIPQLDAEVIGRLNMQWLRVSVVKFIEGVLCTLSGLSLGREGPSVLLGGMAGKGVSRLLKKEQGEEHVLVTCGAAAGMSAAFHAPLTGVLFALEEIHREFNAPLVISVMTAAAMADFVTSQVLGVEPVLHFALVGDLPHIDYAFVLLMGVICGVVGALHNVGMFALQGEVFGRLRRYVGDGVLAPVFLLSGLVAFSFPELLCGGDSILHFLEDGRGFTFALLIALFLGKYIFTALCFGSGAPGGTLLPLVILGALLGAICGMVSVRMTSVPLAYLNNFVVLGIAGMFAASVRAPVTAVVLCFELTGSLDTLLSATAVSLVAFVTANLMNVEPFYEHLLTELLDTLPEPSAMRHEQTERNKVLHVHVVGVGSLAEGKRLDEVPFPADTLVVTIDRAGERIIPKGSTQLQALDELLVIMDADQETNTEEAMRDLCRGMTE